MPELSKLKVVELEKYQEPVLLFLSKMGVAQYVEVDCEEETYEDFLHACPVPKDEAMLNEEIQSRIKKKLEELHELEESGELGKYHIKSDVNIKDAVLPPGNTLMEILLEMEHIIEDIEKKSINIHDLVELPSEELTAGDQKLLEKKVVSKKSKKDKGREFLEEPVNEELHHVFDEINVVIHPSEEKPNKKSSKGKKSLKKPIIKEQPKLDKIQSELLNLEEITSEIDLLLEAEHKMALCDNIVYFEAWVYKKSLKQVEEGIQKITEGKCYIEHEKPKIEDNEPYISKEPPILFEGFRSLLYSLGYPQKGELNPTYLMAITFPFLFGIMFADVGQGAIMVILGIFLLVARKRVKNIEKVGEISRYFLLSAGIIFLCGISAMGFGFIFGEFFGPSGVLHPILLFEIGPFKFGGFDPMHEPLTLLRFTILIGVLFITFGLIIRLFNRLERQEWAHALATICWIWFLIGGFVMWVYWGGISQISSWFGEGFSMFVGLIIVPLILMLIILAKAENFMEGIDITIEVFIESLGHTLSFCRLAALFLTHTALSTMFLELGGVENGHFPLSSIPLVAVGSLLALFIEGLLVMVHCLRLHWIELLPKFYSGKGDLFKPVKTY